MRLKTDSFANEILDDLDAEVVTGCWLQDNVEIGDLVTGFDEAKLYDCEDEYPDSEEYGDWVFKMAAELVNARKRARA